MAKTCLVDTPILSQNNDLMGIDLYVEALADVIADAEAPLTVAIQGEWGSGKTSFMNQLSEKLCSPFGGMGGTSPYFGIWIHSWEFALLKEPTDILVSLMKGLISQMSHEVDKISQKDPKVKECYGKALDIAQRFAKTAFYLAAARFGGLAATDKIEDMLNNTTDEEEASIGNLKKALRNAVAASLSAAPQKKGFIFFIDDLDRLDPVIAVNFLELVKNIFDLPDCIFILAIDYGVVVRGLTPRFGEKTDENEREFRSFFDKIIQLPFKVPVSSYDLEKYLETSLNSIGFLKETDKDFLVNLDWYSAGLIDPTREIYDEDLPIQVRAMDVLMKVTELSTGSNPRAIKRLMNVLALLNKIEEKRHSRRNNDISSGLTDKEKVTLKIMLYCLVSIQIAYPTIYEFLAKHPGFYAWDSEAVEAEGCCALTDQEEAQLNKRGEFNEFFEQAIYQLCQKEFYLRTRSRYVSNIFNIMRALILLSDHEKLFGTSTIEDIDLLDKYDLNEYFKSTLADEDYEQKDSETDSSESGTYTSQEKFSEDEKDENFEENNDADDPILLEMLIELVIKKAVTEIVHIAGATSVTFTPERTPERTAAPRDKREYKKQEVFASYDEYAEGASEQFLELLEQLDEILDEVFPEMLEYEYKIAPKRMINIRPVNKKKKKGNPVLLSVSMLKNKGKIMRVECGGIPIPDLSDSLEPLQDHMDDIVDRFHELSTDVLEEAE